MRRSTAPAATGRVADAVARRLGQRLRRRGWSLRMTVAFGLVVVAFLGEAANAVLLGYAIAFGWVPLVGLIHAATARRPNSPILPAVSLAVDAALVVGTWLIVPEVAGLVVLAQVPLVVYHAHHDPRTLGPLAALLALTLAVLDTAGTHTPGGTGLAHLSVVALLLGGGLWLQREWGRERQWSEARLHTELERTDAMLAGIGDAVVVTGPGGRVRRFSMGAEQAFACPEDVALGLRCHDILGLHDALAALDCSGGCPLVSGTAEPGGDRELWRQLDTGVRQPLLASVRAVHGPGGELREVVHSFRDITRVKLAEEAKTLFLAAASHELKTPVTVIQGFAELLVTRPEMTADQRANALDTIRKRARELDRLIDRLLLTARIDAGHVDTAVEPVALPPILEERAQEVAVATDRRIDLLPSTDVPPAVLASEPAVAIVVEHLLENAIKYSPAGQPVDVSLSVGTHDVAFSVRDRGVGMTPAEQAHCFDRFWQAEPSDVRRFGGSGIGLYVVQSLVHGMGGEVGVETAPGRGSTFTVALRRVDARDDPPEDAASLASVGPRTMIEEFMRQVGVGTAIASLRREAVEGGSA